MMTGKWSKIPSVIVTVIVGVVIFRMSGGVLLFEAKYVGSAGVWRTSVLRRM